MGRPPRLIFRTQSYFYFSSKSERVIEKQSRAELRICVYFQSGIYRQLAGYDEGTATRSTEFETIFDFFRRHSGQLRLFSKVIYLRGSKTMHPEILTYNYVYGDAALIFSKDNPIIADGTFRERHTQEVSVSLSV